MRNTMFMYARMLVMLVISLFTSRVIFQTLGINDYGTYNVVGSIIVFFSFLNNGLSTSTRRFITASLANKDTNNACHTFNVCILSHIIIAFFILLLAETIGLWCLYNILNIPDGRMEAASWVYQLSVFAAILGIIQSPYESAVVATEKMNIYAYMSISDAIFKLLIIFLLQALGGDKLIIYAFLMFGISILNICIRYFYCRSVISFCRLHYTRDESLLHKILSFTSWSILGQSAVVATNQGVSVLVNVFHNVAVNAAQGVAGTVNGIIYGFISGFQTAFNPQIIKSYNNGEHDYLQQLMIRSSKLTSYLLIIFLVPLLFETSNVLSLWLGDYPLYAVEFCILSLICSYVDGISAPLWMLVYAQTEIKQYQIAISSVYAMNFIMAFLCLSLGFLPYHVLTARVFVTIGLVVVRAVYTRRYLPEFNIARWINEVLGHGILIVIIASAIVYFMQKVLPQMSMLLNVLTVTTISISITIMLIATIGLNKEERISCIRTIKQKLHIQ